LSYVLLNNYCLAEIPIPQGSTINNNELINNGFDDRQKNEASNFIERIDKNVTKTENNNEQKSKF
jgi:hypothetical protein